MSGGIDCLAREDIMEAEVLSVEHAVKKFGGLTALDDVSINIQAGEFVGLIGPNGAGKTTLFNAISGAYKLSSGSVFFNGKDVSLLPPHERCHLGIGRTFQITKAFEGISVLENVAIGAMFGRGNTSKLLSRKHLKEGMEKAEEVLEALDFSNKKDVPAVTLNVPERKRLEICRALATEPKILLLDEVIAGLNPSEVDEMVVLLKTINKRGITILMIEHVMRAVMNLSQRLYVLNFGKLIAQGTPNEIASSPIVIEAYLGKIGQRSART